MSGKFSFEKRYEKNFFDAHEIRCDVVKQPIYFVVQSQTNRCTVWYDGLFFWWDRVIEKLRRVSGGVFESPQR